VTYLLTLSRIILLVYTHILEEHTTSNFRVEPCKVRKSFIF
jgi:hypothetical protein